MGFDTYELGKAAVGRALERIEGRRVEVTSLRRIADDRSQEDLKRVGYGEPVLVAYRVSDVEKRCVLHTSGPNWFGHDRRSDRANLVLLAADTYAAVPRHTRVFDVGAMSPSHELVSLVNVGEFYLLTEYAEGVLYARDLAVLRSTGKVSARDLARTTALAAYLVDVHCRSFEAPPEVYERSIRDMVGSGEGIFGIADSYPADGPIAPRRLADLERRCIDWRYRLRSRTHRLRRTHGDFHPYNILFREGTDFTLLDASRGSAGDPADDLAALTINYVFARVVAPESWAGGFAPLWNAFWTAYLDGAKDPEVYEVLPLFFAWRALVVASPVWYPSLSDAERSSLLHFAERGLDEGMFDPMTWMRGGG